MPESSFIAAPAPVESGLTPSHWRLFLASTSPRRSQLLQSIGLPFTVVPNHMHEPDPTAAEERQPQNYVEKLARDKAAACRLETLGQAVPSAHPTDLILAADTIVWHAGRILNKPRDAAEAGAMLRRLRGQRHQVFTGICLRQGEKYFVTHDTTTVHFRAVSDAWIERYVATGEPMDKAGAYAAQGLGAVIIDRIEGDFSNVVGLPLACLARLLEQIGAPLEMWWETSPLVENLAAGRADM